MGALYKLVIWVPMQVLMRKMIAILEGMSDLGEICYPEYENLDSQKQEPELHQASVTARLHCLFVNLHLLGKGVYGQSCQAQGVLQMAMIAYSVSGFRSCSIPQLFICTDVEWI